MYHPLTLQVSCLFVCFLVFWAKMKLCPNFKQKQLLTLNCLCLYYWTCQFIPMKTKLDTFKFLKLFGGHVVRVILSHKINIKQLHCSVCFSAVDPTDRDYLKAVVIFQCNIIGICAVWIIFLCIRIKQQKGLFCYTAFL